MDKKSKSVFELLFEASQAISSEIDLQKLVQRVTDLGTQLSGAQFGAFFYNLVDKKGESYVLYTISGVPREAFSKFPMPRNTKIFNPTFTAQGTVRYDDVTQQANYGQNDPYFGMPKGHLPVRSYLAVPVISPIDKSPIGGLFFGHPDVGIFSSESEKLIEGIAVQAAIAITNARLFEEKKHTEEKLVEQKEQYKSIFNAISDSAIIYDVDGNIVEVNPSACQLFGYSYQEMIGMNASQLFTRSEDFIALKEIALSGREYFGTHTRRRKDGSLIDVEYRGVHFIFRDKPHVLSIAKDAGPSRRTEEALRETRKLSELITNASPVTLWMTDQMGKLVFINQTWLDWVGGNTNEYLKSGWISSVVAEDQDDVRSRFIEAFKNRKQFQAEFRLTRKSGELRWLIAVAGPYYNMDGLFLGYTGSISDITEKKEVENQLFSQNTLINTITNNTLQALFLMNDRQICTYMNPAAELMTGFKLSEVQEKPLHYYIHHTRPNGAHFPLEECAIDRALPTKAQTRGEEVFIHKNGTFFPVAFIASPIIENGIPVGTVIEVRDTTEEKKIQEELRTKEQAALMLLEEKVRERTLQLEHTNDELMQFASVASHDLKEPVRKVSIFSRMMKEQLGTSLTPPCDRYLNSIIHSSQRMAQLIDDLLLFSRVSNTGLEFQDVDLNSVVDLVLNDLELLILERNAHIHKSTLPTIKGIAMHLGQVFQNLISNSLKFAHAERTLEIVFTCSRQSKSGSQFWVIKYEDNGIGFSQDQADKIFDVFYRIHPKEQYEGTGVGLAIVKKIITFHHGDIQAIGRPGEGAEFVIKFPCEEAIN